MSELINNLQQIYNAKLSIKAAIGTQSDELADYAGYITALKPNGYTYINENGDFNVSSYEYAYIDVPTGGGETIAQKNAAWKTKWAPVLSTMAAGLYQQDPSYGEPQISDASGWCIQTAIDGDAAMSEMIAMACLWIEIYGSGSLLHNQYAQIFTQMGLTLDSDGYLVSTDDDKLIPFDADEALISNLMGVEGFGVVGGKRISSLNGGVENAPWDYYGLVFNGSGFDYVSLGQFNYVVDQGAMIRKMNADGVTFINNIPAVNQSTLFNYLEAFQIDEYTPYKTLNITSNGTFDVTTYASAYVNVPTGGGSEPESYTLVGGLFINGQGQYYIGDESAPANYINIIPKEDVTGTWSDKFSYLVVGKNTTITGYNYYNGDAFAIQAESYTQSSSLLTYHTARLANIEPYLDKEYYGLGQYYDSAYITVNRSFSNPNGTKLGISREVYGYYFPNSSYTNRYKDLMVDVSYITPVGDDIIGGQATAMAFDNTTYALDLRNIRYCDDYMVYSNTYVTATVGIDGGTIYYEIDLTQSGNYDDSVLYRAILSGGAFFAEMANNVGQNVEPLTVKLEVPSGTFVFDDADWVFLSNNEEMTTGLVVFNEDHNNNPTLQIDTTGVWAMDEFGNWNTTGVGELTVNGINSLKIRFYVDSSDNTWQYDWLIDVDYEWTPDGEEPEPEE